MTNETNTPGTDSIQARLDANEALCAVASGSIRRDMAFHIWCCERNLREDSVIHGQLGRVYGFHRAYPGSAR